MKLSFGKVLQGASVLALLASAPAHAQETTSTASSANTDVDIVVTARRRDELLQDVPLTVNAVGAQEIQNLGLRDFTEIASVVPGLSLKADNIAPNASIRGVNMDVYSSGNNGTVEFYLDDAPATATSTLQSMYDVGQIEVLRGPQGTLRGRASPSGSITLTTHRPDLEEYGGYLETTVNDIGGVNTNGAFNIPLIEDKLAIRVAGLHNEDEGDRVESTSNSLDPYSRTSGGRFSILFEPTSNLSIQVMHDHLVRYSRGYGQVESASIADPSNVFTAPAGGDISPRYITAGDRLSVADTPMNTRQENDTNNLQIEYRFAGQKLNYVGSEAHLDLTTNIQFDPGDYFGGAYNGVVPQGGRQTHSQQVQETHELRLSSDERLLGVLDYVIGGYASWNSPDSALVEQTLLHIDFNGTDGTPPSLAAGNIYSVNNTNILRLSESEERSLFGNLTWHIDDATELSAGARYISYQTQGALIVSGSTLSEEDERYHHTIYSVSLKHNFTDNLMTYASIGTSWRPAVNAIGDFNPSAYQGAVEAAHQNTPPETSTSYEVGLKSDWFNRRLRLNLTAYHQEFDNYPFRAGGDGLYYAAIGSSGWSVSQFNFVSAVPVIVDGLELESGYRITDRWNVDGVLSYANGRIDGGKIACNDLNGDGQQDTTVPSLSDLQTYGIQECATSQRSSFAPQWTASVQSEYSREIWADTEGFLRGQVSWYGDSQNDPSNSIDDVDSYAILNLFAGIRDPDGQWSLTFYAKNLGNVERVLSRDATPLGVSWQNYDYVTGHAVADSGTSNYRQITMTPEQEVGVTLRMAFGSH